MTFWHTISGIQEKVSGGTSHNHGNRLFSCKQRYKLRQSYDKVTMS